jgi:methylated-DNA-[protein]-cysteine S-methyltransferase
MKDELSTFQTEFGWCAMLGRGELLRALTFGHRNADDACSWLLRRLTADIRRAKWNQPLAQRIAEFLDGEPHEFRDVQLDLAHLTPFANRVVNACRRIHWGQTASYCNLADKAGSAGAARAVGQVMASNRTPLVVPCHRVISTGGRLGGFSAPQGLAMKRRLLALESAALCR